MKRPHAADRGRDDVICKVLPMLGGVFGIIFYQLHFFVHSEPKRDKNIVAYKVWQTYGVYQNQDNFR